jgi:ABC-type multidrug transport system ATPase subunit
LNGTVVKQQDRHWQYLTCRETLIYAAELYDIAFKTNIPVVVDDIIAKMGLDVCKNVKCGRLSGGQKRRLSIAIALLKQPAVIFLDEPTSGLDAASASHIMKEIKRIATAEKLIIICTIHQPSTKVYNGFDNVMILSKGREAFHGKQNDAEGYFESIGHPMPRATNPAEFFLDLVNADFSTDDEVDSILDAWETHKKENNITTREASYDSISGTSESRSVFKEISVLLRRHAILILRDPILYAGRAIIFLLANLFFALVYLKARPYTQDQALNKMVRICSCSSFELSLKPIF